MSIWQQSDVQVDYAFQDMIKHAKNGDDDAIAYLYDHFFKLVFGYICNRTKDYHTAEDLTSAVFVKMVENICKIRANNEVGFRAWLLKVADRTIAQHFACEKIKCVPLEEAPEIPCVTEKQSAVTEAFNKITEEQKQVLDGTVILGYKAEEFGRLSGKKASAVRSLQFRGLSTMKRILVAATLIVLFLLGATIKFIYDATPASPLYRIKILGERIVPFQQEQKPQVQPTPYRNQESAPLPSIAPMTPTSTATSTPVSTRNAIVQPSPTATPILATPAETSKSDCVVDVAGMCL